MSAQYEETVEGETLLRHPPSARHEEICDRLHQRLATCLAGTATTRVLSSRSVVQLSPGTIVRPDLTLVAKASGKVWLVAEVISSEDHHTDTVVKKQIYEDLNLPRLWMIDPRYDNVEVYHGTPYGMALKHILAGREILIENLLPGFQLTVAELFGVPVASRREE